MYYFDLKDNKPIRSNGLHSKVESELTNVLSLPLYIFYKY